MTACPEREYIASAVAALEEPSRELWRPTRADTLAAIETLLLSNISREARSAIRDIEFEVIHGRKPS